MLLVSAAIALVVVAAAVGVGVRARRRRAARAHGLSLAAPTRWRAPAGVNHLADRVSELSDRDVHLHGGATHRRSLGALLGSSSGASR